MRLQPRKCFGLRGGGEALSQTSKAWLPNNRLAKLVARNQKLGEKNLVSSFQLLQNRTHLHTLYLKQGS
jgi:hypothetical protein